MKLKRISKSSIKIFIASLFLTAFFTVSIMAFAVVERNSLKTGIYSVKTPLSLYYSQNEIRLIVNDREMKLDLNPILEVIKSRGFAAVVTMLMTL